jgi:multicomponent Na+:H+ antiporter subunit D
MLENLPPFVLFFAGALVLPFLPRALRGWFFLAPPLASLWFLSGFQDGFTLSWPFLGWELEPLRVDRLSLLFGWVFALAAFAGGLYALHLRDTGQQVSALLYAGSALGVVFAGDLLTLLVFWEIMALTSAYLVWARGTPASMAAGMRYLYVHLAGGSALMGGILLHFGETGSLAFGSLGPGLASTLILMGFAVNAAAVPLHAWIADAYPEATVTGAVFMAAFTTKSAVYALARGFAGWEILVAAGVLSALVGVVYSLITNDVRRVLAYLVMGQVGFMVAGVGLGSEMALNGAVAHAFAGVLYKGLLFMAAGAVIHATGSGRLTDLGGLARTLPWVLAFYLVGALGMAGAPLFAGFVSKSITLEAAAYAGRGEVYILLYLASIGAFLAAGLRIPFLVWGGEPTGGELKPIPWNMTMAMAFTAGITLLLGVWPEPLYSLLPGGTEYEPYTYSHVLKAVQLLGFTFLAFAMLRKKLGREATIVLDADWVYRRPARLSYALGPQVVAGAFGAVERVAYGVVGQVIRVGRDPVGWLVRARGREREVAHGSFREPGGGGAETASTTLRISMTAGAILVLSTLLVLFFRIMV